MSETLSALARMRGSKTWLAIVGTVLIAASIVIFVVIFGGVGLATFHAMNPNAPFTVDQVKLAPVFGIVVIGLAFLAYKAFRAMLEGFVEVAAVFGGWFLRWVDKNNRRK